MDEKPQWAVVEIFGHDRYVGIIGEYQIGGESFIRVDVPKTKKNQEFTKLFGKGAIYSITFIDEVTGSILAGQLESEPIKLWQFLDYQSQALLNSPQEIKEVDSNLDEDSEWEAS